MSNTVRVTKKELASALNEFPAHQLRDTLLVTKQLLILIEGHSLTASIPFSLPVKELNLAGLSVTKVETALRVYQRVHKAKYGLPKKNAGIASQPPPLPKIKMAEDKLVLWGILFIPLEQIETDLAKRDGVAPHNRISLTFRRDGIYQLDPKLMLCDLTKQQHQCLQYLYAHSTTRLKKLAQTLKTESPNARRCIREINEKFAHQMHRDIIVRRNAGYLVDQDHFTVADS